MPCSSPSSTAPAGPAAPPDTKNTEDSVATCEARGSAVEIAGGVVEYLVSGLVPDEGARMLVPVGDPTVERTDEVGNAVVGAAP